MKIDKTFKIKEKYFNAILRFEKPFELRHEKVEPNSIIKLECDELGVSRLYKVVSCNILNKAYDCYYCYGSKYKTTTLGDENDGITLYRFYENLAEIELEDWYNDGGAHHLFDWYDNFCWDYINKAPTYLIEIAEILEVK